MTPMRMPGISFISLLTVPLSFFRTCVRHGYMLPVVSKEKTTSIALSIMDGPLGSARPDRWGPGARDGFVCVSDKQNNMSEEAHPQGFAERGRTLVVQFRASRRGGWTSAARAQSTLARS